jgi:hypothetical protein
MTLTTLWETGWLQTGLHLGFGAEAEVVHVMMLAKPVT